MDYKYFVFPVSEANMAKIPSLVAALPDAMKEFRTSQLVQKSGIVTMGGVNCGLSQ
jgi:hypothetical protein